MRSMASRRASARDVSSRTGVRIREVPSVMMSKGVSGVALMSSSRVCSRSRVASSPCRVSVVRMVQSSVE